MSGNVFIGVTVMVDPASKAVMRVMQSSFGLPLISALHEPQRPALQFQRHREIGLLLGLDLVDGVEDDHARVGLDLVLLEARRCPRRSRPRARS